MRRFSFWSFIALMLALMALCIGLGVWQLERLGEKEALIARVAERLDAAPEPFPLPSQWNTLLPDDFEFRSVGASGHFRHDLAVLVFTALAEPRGRFSGPGYWIVTPFALDGGGSVLVNRGFVPQGRQDAFRTDMTGPQGAVTLSGIARRSEIANAFSPPVDAGRRIASVRDTAALAAILPPELQPVAPLTIDLPSALPGALPQGGETRVSFPNNHFGYALTWFGFAALIPVLLFAWVRLQGNENRKTASA